MAPRFRASITSPVDREYPVTRLTPACVARHASEPPMAPNPMMPIDSGRMAKIPRLQELEGLAGGQCNSCRETESIVAIGSCGHNAHSGLDPSGKAHTGAQALLLSGRLKPDLPVLFAASETE